MAARAGVPPSRRRQRLDRRDRGPTRGGGRRGRAPLAHDRARAELARDARGRPATAPTRRGSSGCSPATSSCRAPPTSCCGRSRAPGGAARRVGFVWRSADGTTRPWRTVRETRIVTPAEAMRRACDDNWFAAQSPSGARGLVVDEVNSAQPGVADWQAVLQHRQAPPGPLRRRAGRRAQPRHRLTTSRSDRLRSVTQDWTIRSRRSMCCAGSSQGARLASSSTQCTRA